MFLRPIAALGVFFMLLGCDSPPAPTVGSAVPVPAQISLSPLDGHAKRGDRYPEAITAWRAQAIALGDSALAKRVSEARDSAGYWTERHREGEARRRDDAKRPFVSPAHAMFGAFIAGDTAAGFAARNGSSPK